MEFSILNNPEWGTMLFSLIVFITLFLLLRRYAFGPLLKVMQERADKIDADIQHAEQQREEAQRLLEKQEATLNEARQDATRILENARATSEKQAETIIKTAREEAEQFRTLARKELEREKEKAIEALRAELGQITVLLAEKVVHKQLDEELQEQLVDEYLKEVGTKKWVQ